VCISGACLSDVGMSDVGMSDAGMSDVGMSDVGMHLLAWPSHCLLVWCCVQRSMNGLIFMPPARDGRMLPGVAFNAFCPVQLAQKNGLLTRVQPGLGFIR
jgi:hypothetical protein